MIEKLKGLKYQKLIHILGAPILFSLTKCSVLQHIENS